MSRFSVLGWFMPIEALPLVLVGGGLLVIFRVVRPTRLLVFVFGFAMLPVLVEPALRIAFDIMPLWLIVSVFLVLAMSLFKGIAALFIGERASDEMMGSLAASAVRGTLRSALRCPLVIIRAITRLRALLR